MVKHSSLGQKVLHDTCADVDLEILEEKVSSDTWRTLNSAERISVTKFELVTYQYGKTIKVK